MEKEHLLEAHHWIPEMDQRWSHPMRLCKIKCYTTSKESTQENQEPFYQGAAKKEGNAQRDEMLY